MHLSDRFISRETTTATATAAGMQCNAIGGFSGGNAMAQLTPLEARVNQSTSNLSNNEKCDRHYYSGTEQHDPRPRQLGYIREALPSKQKAGGSSSSSTTKKLLESGVACRSVACLGPVDIFQQGRSERLGRLVGVRLTSRDPRSVSGRTTGP